MFIDRLAICCMQTEVLALQDGDRFAFLSNSLQNHVTLAELVMVGPVKLMVGHRPQQAGVWLRHCMHDVIQRLCIRTVPSGFTFHRWKPGVYILYGKFQISILIILGKTETTEDQMKTTLVQLQYTYTVKEYDLKRGTIQNMFICT